MSRRCRPRSTRSGATFTKGFYEVAIAGYKKVQLGVTVNYNATGSGAVRPALQDGVVDYAGSDGLVNAADVSKYKGEFVYIPTVATPITVSYNLTDVEETDTRRRHDRQDLPAPDQEVGRRRHCGPEPRGEVPRYRYHRRPPFRRIGDDRELHQVPGGGGPGTWTLKSGSTVEWPANTQAGNGNQGVAQIVKSTAGAVGYVDLSDAKASGLQFAKVKNKSGKAVVANLDGATSALGGAQVNADLSYNPLNAEGGVATDHRSTWILAYKTSPTR